MHRQSAALKNGDAAEPPAIFTRSRSGIALLHVVILLVLIGGLVIAGYKMMGPIIQRGKITDTKKIINNNVDAIIGWTVANCRIPDAGSVDLLPAPIACTVAGGCTFEKVAHNPNDAWGNRLAYLYDRNLAKAASCAALCGAAGTGFSVGTLNNVAFVISSSQYSASFHNTFSSGTTLNGAVPTLTYFSGGNVVGTLNQVATDPPDILRVVTLHELKARIGCAGYTWGQLRILDNELPSVYADSYSSYNVTMFADGGAPAYTWPTAGLSVSPSSGLPLTIDPVTGKLTITSVPTVGTYTVTIQVTDQNGTVVQRSYTLKVLNSNPTGGGTTGGGINNDGGDAAVVTPTGSGFTSSGNLISFGLNQNNSSGCFFYPYNFPLLGKTLRAYWNFCYAGIDTSATSSSLADGYTFTMMQATNPATYCGTGTTYNAVTNPRFDCSSMGGLGEYLAYCGLPGQSIAAEFDIYPSGGRNDPTGSYNHLAIVKALSTHSAGGPAGLYGDNTHGQGDATARNPSCNGTDTGCLFGTMTGHSYPVTWLENDGCTPDKSSHNARVEIHTRCNNDCSQCETNSCTTTTLIKIWVDRGWLGNCTGTCNGTAITNAKCAGLCKGTCDGAAITAASGATCVASPWRGLCTGTCDGVSVTSAKCAGLCTGSCTAAGTTTAITGASCMDKDWYLPCTGTCDGVAITNGKCLITTPGTGKCTGTCNGTPVSNTVCNKSSFITLGSDETLTPDLKYCTTLPTALNQYKVGFTQATGGAVQYGYIGDFMLKSYSACPPMTISPASLPNGTVGVPYSATLTASGGTPPYSNWQWTAANIAGITASNLPPGLSMSTTGVISGTPTTAGTYNTILASVQDSCTADTCTNTVSKSYSITIGLPPAPTCTLTATPAQVAYNSTTTLNWNITNGPANGSWSIAPGGTCSNFSNSTGGTCTSGALTTPGTTIYTLTVSNAGGSNSCSATVKVGCKNYRVWNSTGARIYFRNPAGTCVRIADTKEITTAAQLGVGQFIRRYSATDNLCTTELGRITYNDAMTADLGGDGQCDVNYTSSDTAAER